MFFDRENDSIEFELHEYELRSCDDKPFGSQKGNRLFKD